MIEIKNIMKQFQNETAIEYKDITFETGKSYMLLGASGCGKYKPGAAGRPMGAPTIWQKIIRILNL